MQLFKFDIIIKKIIIYIINKESKKLKKNWKKFKKIEKNIKK